MYIDFISNFHILPTFNWISLYHFLDKPIPIFRLFFNLIFPTRNFW